MYEYHPIASLFPMLEGDRFNDLKEDIRANGLHEPIVLYEGKVLDGRNRLSACIEAGEQPRFSEYSGDDPVGYVLSLNLHRRHLNESQRAMVAAKVANLSHGGNRKDQAANLQDGRTRAEAAELLNVSERSVNTAKKVERDGIDDLRKSVESGDISVSAAEKISGFSDEEQEEIITEIEGGEAPAKAIEKHVHVSKNSGNNEWYTPKNIIDSAKTVMGGIDLDPASSEIANGTVCAGTFYTDKDNSLERAWEGRIWMNPPYSQPLINKFIEKLCSSDVEAIVLVNNATETNWFQTLAERCSSICLIRKRVRFLDVNGDPGSPLQGQIAAYIGNSVSLFNEEFSKHGMVFVR